MTTVKELKEKLKPCLRRYLEMQGVKFVNAKQFHCFNGRAHKNNDNEASASITKDGMGYKCFTCGITGDIFTACSYLEGRAAQGKDFMDMLKYLALMFHIPYEPVKGERTSKYDNEAEYIYTNADNKPVYKIVRMVNQDNKKDKKFYPYMYNQLTGKYNERSGFSENCVKELYCLTDVNKAIKAGEYVFLVEGEKCADILRNMGLSATCVPGGAMAWKKPHSIHYTASLCNASVIILPDNDTAGHKFAKQAAEDINAVANSVKILELEGLPVKGDIEQWLKLDKSHTKEKLLELCGDVSYYTKALDKSIGVYVQDGTYRHRGKEEDKTISNFIILPKECVEKDGVHYFFADAVTNNGKKIKVEFSSEVFVNKIAFKKAFQNINFSFTGNDEDLQYIKRLISDYSSNYKTGVEYIGLHKVRDKYIFVGNDRSLTHKNVEDENTVLMPQYKIIETYILNNGIITQNDIKTVMNSLFNYNTPDKTALIAGFITACMYKAHFMESGIDFPHLLIFGEAGSGKTQTIEKVVKPFFGIRSSYSADQLTPFAAMKICSSSNMIPFIIEEYKPRKISERIKNTISALLRNAYNNFAGVRGLADQSIRSYNLINPIILIGEESIIESAIQERSLELSYGKADLNDEAKRHFDIIRENREIICKLGKTILLSALDISPNEVMEAYRNEEVALNNKENLQSRVANNICVAAAGIRMLDKVLNAHGLSIETCTGCSIEAYIGLITNAVKENVLSSNGAGISAVDATIEAFDRMAVQDRLIKGIDYMIITSKDGYEHIALDVRLIYDKFTRYVKEFNIQDEMITSQAAFTRQLRRADYFLKYTMAKFKNADGIINKRAYMLDLNAINEKMELQRFVSEIYSKINDDDDDDDNPFNDDDDNPFNNNQLNLVRTL